MRFLLMLHFVVFAWIVSGDCLAELPNPVLSTVFPAGAKAGDSVEVEIAGKGLDQVTSLDCRAAAFRIEQNADHKSRFTITVPLETPAGFYDLRAVCRNGISSPRPFFVGNRPELREDDANETNSSAQTVPPHVSVNGRMDRKGDLDHFRFTAKAGQLVVIECWAERIDSRLRAVLEICDRQGRRLASNRGYFGIDPLIAFRVPADGDYVVKLYDLVFAGGAEYYYRLDIDTGPRVAFSVPSVVEHGKPARVTLFGWNLATLRSDVNVASSDVNVADAAAQATRRIAAPTASGGGSPFVSGSSGQEWDRVEVDIPAALSRGTWPLPVRLQPAQASLQGFPHYLPGGHAPLFIGVTDVPVVTADFDNHSPASARTVAIPCEVSGRLVGGSQQDWFAIDCRRGEVVYVEGFAERINSPVDLDVRIFDARGKKELAQFGDELNNIGGASFPTNHLDPAGRWVVPHDGRFLILARNIIGNTRADPRRVYRLSIRREEPDFSLAVVSRRSDPSGLNVARGGRVLLDVMAFRRRGQTGAIRISADELPSGIECPDTWIGPGVDRATLVVSAARDAPPSVGELRLTGSADRLKGRTVRAGVVVRTGLANGWGRLAADMTWAIAGDAPVRITAEGHEPRDHHLYGDLTVRHSPGGTLDVAIRVDRRDDAHLAPVKLIGVGLPDLIQNQTATIPAGASQGYISFHLPPTLPTGHYSLVVQGETTVSKPNGQAETVTVCSNAVTFEVHPPAFRIELDPDAPRRIRRGEVVQVKYSVTRCNGFIGKIHTELAVPGHVTDVPGLRGRGVTTVGQTSSGTIQIIANDDAPLGQQPFLRLYGVGSLEDKPVFHGSCFLDLEIVVDRSAVGD